MTRETGSRRVLPLMVLGLLVQLQGAPADSAAAPILVGQWKVAQYACVTFESVLKVNSAPVFDAGAAPEVLMVITRQKGAVFAGYFSGFIGEGDKQLLTGVINSDNSVSIQFAGHNYRSLVAGHYSLSGAKKLIKATYSQFEEYLASNPSMSSGFLALEKK